MYIYIYLYVEYVYIYIHIYNILFFFNDLKQEAQL